MGGASTNHGFAEATGDEQPRCPETAAPLTCASPEAALAHVYDQGVAAYDQFWAPALHRHARALVDALPPAGASRVVVDVAGGAGRLAPALAAVAGPGGRVVVVDRSLGMLRQAPRGLPRAQADAARLPVATAVVDVAVFAFVLFLLPDARRAVAEAARVLRPAGWLLAATWGTTQSTAADMVVREELDAAGVPPFPVLPRSDALTNSPPRIAALLEAAGFRAVCTRSHALDATFDPASVLALRTGSGELGWRFGLLDPAVRAQVQSRVADRLNALLAAGFVDRSEVLLTWARAAET